MISKHPGKRSTARWPDSPPSCCQSKRGVPTYIALPISPKDRRTAIELARQERVHLEPPALMIRLVQLRNGVAETAPFLVPLRLDHEEPPSDVPSLYEYCMELHLEEVRTQGRVL